ncbi:MAG: RNA polymerase sigma factor RpoD/SigA [Bacteroidales bacterium]|nr:sigma-70 family RNA polymerase sigma factor [Bacteroidales bacterium]
MRQLKIIRQVTHREDLSIDKYLCDISRENLLSAEEEGELARRIRKNNDEEALEKLIKGNLRFVVSVAKQYQNQGLSLPDLINEGNLGLIKAATRFDETRGFKFISYAVWWIRQSILQALAEQARIVRIPLNKIGSISKINKTLTELEQKHEREPSLQEISKVVKLAPEEIKEALKHTNKPLSMDAPLNEADEDSMYEVMESDDNPPPDDNLMHESLNREIERALSSLTEREATIIKLYYGLANKHPFTLEEIGEKINLTRERVRQIKEKAIKKLKHTTRNKILKSYLG